MTPKINKNPTPSTFEDAMSRLEKLTEAMQHPDLPIEDALERYEEGLGLVRYCRDKLTSVEQKLQILDHDELVDLNLDAENDAAPDKNNPVVDADELDDDIRDDSEEDNDIPF